MTSPCNLIGQWAHGGHQSHPTDHALHFLGQGEINNFSVLAEYFTTPSKTTITAEKIQLRCFVMLTRAQLFSLILSPLWDSLKW